MFDFIIAIVLAFGGGGWLFFQLNHRSGDANNGSNFTGGIIAAVIIFIIVFTFLRYVVHLS